MASTAVIDRQGKTQICIWHALMRLKCSTIGEREGIHRSTINELLRLALLAPDIVQATYKGTLPRAVSLEAILRAKVPLDWDEQRRLIASLG